MATINELLSTYSEGKEKAAHITLYKYLAALEQAEVLKRVNRRLPAKQGRGSVQWFLAIDLGPKTPVWRQQGKAVYDPNSGYTYPTTDSTSLERSVIQSMRDQYERSKRLLQENLKGYSQDDLQEFDIDTSNFWSNATRVFSFLSAYGGAYKEVVYKDLFAMNQIRLGTVEINWMKFANCDCNPFQFRFTFGLWILAAISKLNEEETIRIPYWAPLFRVMKLLGFDVQQPLYGTWDHATSETWKWRGKILPEICEEARARCADIYFVESAEVSYKDRIDNTCLVKDEVICTEAAGLKNDLKMILALNPGGNILVKFTKGSLTAEVFKEFLMQILLGAGKPILLVVERSEIYNSKLIKAFVDAEKHHIKLFSMPATK
jgi:hypothetical protein